MSYVKSFVTTDKEHVQACHSTVKNILDWAVRERHRNLKQTLQILFPLSGQWTQKRTAAAAKLDEEENGEAGEEEEEEPSTPAASFSGRSGGNTAGTGRAVVSDYAVVRKYAVVGDQAHGSDQGHDSDEGVAGDWEALVHDVMRQTRQTINCLFLAALNFTFVIMRSGPTSSPL